MDLSEFLLARFAEDEAAAHPRTVIVSGGTPAPEVPNCIGPSGTGDCPQNWHLSPEPHHHWWKRDDVQRLMREHELGHASPPQRRALAECEAKRRIVEQFRRLCGPVEIDARTDAERAIGERDLAVAQRILEIVCHYLALPYADHPDYRQKWRP